MTNPAHVIVACLLALTVAACSDSSGPSTADISAPGPDITTGSDLFATQDTPLTGDPGGQGDSDSDSGSDSEADSDSESDSATAPDSESDSDSDSDSATAPDSETPPPTGPSLAVDPELYAFPYISPLNETLIKQFTLYNAGDAPLHIVGLSTTGSPDFSISLLPPLPKTVQPQKATIVRVGFTQGDGDPGWLRIESNDPARPVIEVPLTSYVKGVINSPEPCAELKPSALNFGQVVRGNTVTKQATLTNCSSTATLTLKQVTRSAFLFFPLSDEFQIANLPALPKAIGPGQSVVLDVSYAPKLAGPDSGYFLLHTDDAATPTLQLDVSGVGLAPPLTEIGLHITLSWDTDDTDVDMHLLAPGGAMWDCQSDCYFGNPAPDWGVKASFDDDPFLDVDDVDGFGPENINISEPQPGLYTFKIHYYDDTYDDSFPQSSNATVKLLSYGTVIQTWGPTHLDHTGRTWDVFTVEWPSLTVTTLGALYNNSTSGGFCFP
jgi:hypothetical protein